LAWLGAAALLVMLSMIRPVFGASLYFLTFFLFPASWWWGKELPDLRWNLYAGVLFLAAVMLGTMRQAPARADTSRSLGLLAILILANATFVHLIFAADTAISLEAYILLAKFVLLFFLLRMAVKTPTDLRIVLWAMALGAAYIGYEVTINDRGSLTGSRLEGIGAAGVQNANQLASLMVAVLPLVGALFFLGRRWEKVGAAILAGFVLNVLILCNSRGAFLSTIAAGIVFFLVCGGPGRKQAVRALGLAALATFLLLGDPDITNRFLTTFSSAEERDSSADNRLLFWRAGLNMVADHPFGAGGGGFAKVYSGRYLTSIGINVQSRAVHNGFINEMCEWGIQGLALKLLFVLVAVTQTRRALKLQSYRGDPVQALLGACFIGALAGFLGTCLFGDYMDEEWGFWLVALMSAYSRMYGCSTAPVVEEKGLSRRDAEFVLPEPAHARVNA